MSEKERGGKDPGGHSSDNVRRVPLRNAGGGSPASHRNPREVCVCVCVHAANESQVGNSWGTVNYTHELYFCASEV